MTLAAHYQHAGCLIVGQDGERGRPGLRERERARESDAVELWAGKDGRHLALFLSTARHSVSV